MTENRDGKDDQFARFPPNILSVGQSPADAFEIERLLVRRFAAVVETAASADEALDAATTGSYDLILVNRILVRTEESGLDLIARIVALPHKPKVMLISDKIRAHLVADDLKAERGFGKKQLHDSSTVDALAEALGILPLSR